jgi:RND family efflux transporter MFP subunit
MPPPDRGPTGEHSVPGADTRETDYGRDVQATESHSAFTTFPPLTGDRVKRIAVIVAVCFVLAFAVVRTVRFIGAHNLAKATERSLAEPRLVDLITAKPVQSTQELTLPGQTAAWYASTIFARVNGFVGKWMADIGDRVHKGQVLATIETPELDAQLAAARAQLRASEAQLVTRQSELGLARTTNERWRDSPKGVVSEQEREEKRADYETAAARLKAAEAQVALDRARVDQFAALSEFKSVVAPFDGVIAERRIDIGNLVTAGSTASTTPLYQITQNSPLRVFVDVPQNVVGDVTRPGQAVEVHTQGPDGVALAATVARSAGAVNAQARTVRVEVDVPNTPQALLPGMYVKVAFKLAPRGAVQVPAAALVFRADGPYVALVGDNSKVEFRKVAIARDDGGVLELGSGVAPGDRLALNISSQIKDGDLVRINSADTPGAERLAGGH